MTADSLVAKGLNRKIRRACEAHQCFCSSLIVLIKRCNEDWQDNITGAMSGGGRETPLVHSRNAVMIREDKFLGVLSADLTLGEHIQSPALRTWSHRECKALRNFPIYGCRKPEGSEAVRSVYATYTTKLSMDRLSASAISM